MLVVQNCALHYPYPELRSVENDVYMHAVENDVIPVSKTAKIVRIRTIRKLQGVEGVNLHGLENPNLRFHFVVGVP